MWMWAVRRVPWRTLIRHAPTIVEAARGYYSATRRTTAEREPERERAPAVGNDALRRAIERLEDREVQHAAIVADLAKEVAEMATAVGVLRARLSLALWGAGIAGLVALAALVVVVWNGR
jgi:hypothetical protein